ncbi:F-box domain [Dillenia turbinata]|uniref:F-box domain n=1 Tax=Dillenia turbinata TaxID=194707 RepID=A0AAN8ZJ94_9MAGN
MVKKLTATPEMDPEIWSKLPPEILEQILSCLPLKKFFSLLSTCKQFKSLLFSPTFISKHTSTSPFSSFILLSYPQFQSHFSLYDTNLNHWRNRVLSLSLPLLSSDSPSASSLLSSSNGLFCFSLPNSSCLLISNFVAKTTRHVKFPTHPFDFELLTLISTPRGYKIFALCSGFSSNSAFVYDSKTQCWGEFNVFQPILSNNHNQEGVHNNGFLYFTTPEPFSIVGFDLSNGNWKQLELIFPSDLTFVRLVSGEDKIYVIGGIGRNGISRSMKLWELRGEEMVEVVTLPELMCRKFLSVCYHNYEHVYGFWHQGMICVCCHTWPEILYYKVSRRTWHWLPKCPSLPDKWSCGFRWFSFVPELYTSV